MNERIVCPGMAQVTTAGWQVLRALQPLDLPTAEALREHLTPLLVDGAAIALDLRRHDVDADARLVLAALCARALDSGAHLVVVSELDGLRATLRADGVAHVHESLDAGLHDDAAALRTPRDPQRVPLLPAAADATLLAAQDIAGHDTR
jgi:hypothetical protein